MSNLPKWITAYWKEGTNILLYLSPRNCVHHVCMCWGVTAKAIEVEAGINPPAPKTQRCLVQDDLFLFRFLPQDQVFPGENGSCPAIKQG